jgi:hypothetical protein
MFITAWRATQSLAAAFRTPLRLVNPPVIAQNVRPDKASPAAVAQLTGRCAPWLATLADLAQRGVVRIGEAAPSRLCRLAGREDKLTTYEQMLLDAIFSDQETDGVALKSVAPRVAWQADRLEETLEAELTALGWLDPARRRQREQRLAFSVRCSLVGAAVLIVGLVLDAARLASTLGQAGMALGVGLAVLGVAALIVGLASLWLGTAFSTLSEQGELAAAQWQGYALFLKQVLLGHEPPPEPFDACLPQAVALGLLIHDMVRSRPPQGAPSLPPWLHALATLRETGDWGAKLALLAVAEAEPGETLPTSPGH